MKGIFLKQARLSISAMAGRLGMALLLLSCAAPLAACGPDSRQMVKCTQAVPAALMTCRAKKPYPDPATATQADVAATLVDLDGVADDCKNKLYRLGELAQASQCRLISTPQTAKNAGSL